MSDDMLISFTSPLPPSRETARNYLAQPPLIACPGDDPFELAPYDPFTPMPEVSCRAKNGSPRPNLLAPPRLDIPGYDATTPSPMLRRAFSDVDISGVVPGQFLVSSTPLVSHTNTPTRSSRSVPRRSVLTVDDTISCDLVKSKLDFINKVKQNIVFGQGNPRMNRSRSISNLPDSHDTSVQHKIFSSTMSTIAKDQETTVRGRHSTNFSPPMDARSADSTLTLSTDGMDVPQHETSALLSFLASPRTVVADVVSKEHIRDEAYKIAALFALSAHDDYNPKKEEDGCDWINSSQLPEAWFDDDLDCESVESDDFTDYKEAKRTSELEMEAIKIRLNRLRRSFTMDESKPQISSVPVEKVQTYVSAPASREQPDVKVKEEVPSPEVVQPAVPVEVPQLSVVPAMKPKPQKPVAVRKGPLKAVVPVTNMVTKSLSSSELIKTKPAIDRGRQSRPSTAQEPRRSPSLSSRRSTSASPHRPVSTPPVKNQPSKLARPPIRPPIRAKPVPPTGKGKENRA